MSAVLKNVYYLTRTHCLHNSGTQVLEAQFLYSPPNKPPLWLSSEFICCLDRAIINRMITLPLILNIKLSSYWGNWSGDATPHLPLKSKLALSLLNMVSILTIFCTLFTGHSKHVSSFISLQDSNCHKSCTDLHMYFFSIYIYLYATLVMVSWIKILNRLWFCYFSDSFINTVIGLLEYLGSASQVSSNIEKTLHNDDMPPLPDKTFKLRTFISSYSGFCVFIN